MPGRLFAQRGRRSAVFRAARLNCTEVGGVGIGQEMEWVESQSATSGLRTPRLGVIGSNFPNFPNFPGIRNVGIFVLGGHG
jgi:hypothetical protein